ncbi:hypothetical protein PV10_00485 [Exophiala mesophila]|uniref:Enoyl reductase (ER) domain-containing protein n=1 Tax=Exophiala mesophila TaxID=212818 RepID=A0A0D1ZPW2_EXOME|nr:uncharacterized protein PV10_00485 [Exophiala mesophila]KIV96647.1 hypothetical protein PV10_00485 [Exophiala mesophila]
MSVPNRGLVHTKVPTGWPVPGEHVTVQDTGSFDPKASPPANGMVLKTLYASFDPYLRGLLRHPESESYTSAAPVGAAIPAGLVAQVLSSNHPDYSTDDLVVAMLPIREYNIWIHDDKAPRRPIKVDPKNAGGDPRHFLGALGMPGLTAFSSFYEIGKPKKGETIVVTSAAGAVGQLVGQLAKKEGLTVLGSVGSDDKLDFILKDLGFDAGWNYKKEKSTKEVINKLTDGKGIDIFYDNVGGEQLEGGLDTLHDFGRIIACGQISQYNLEEKDRYPIRNSINTVVKRLLWQGFIVSDPNMGAKYSAEHQKVVGKWISEGSFQPKIHETVGIENAAEAFVGMLRGENFGKAILKFE